MYGQDYVDWLEVNGMNMHVDGLTFDFGGCDFNMTGNGACAPRGDGGRALVHDGGDALSINYANDFTGGTQMWGGLRVQGIIWGGPWGANPTIYANWENHTGGGVAISDDGGFFDFNDGWIQMRGSLGVHMTGHQIIDRGCPSGWSRFGDLCINGNWGCNIWPYADHWCRAVTGAHACTSAEVNGIRWWWGWFGSNDWYMDSDGDNEAQFFNCACGAYTYDQDGNAFKGDCRNWYCCLSL